MRVYGNVAKKKPLMCGFSNKNQSRIQTFCHFNLTQASLSHASTAWSPQRWLIAAVVRPTPFERYWPEWRDGRNVNCNRWGGNEENKITQRMKTGNRCPAVCAFAVKSVASAGEGEIEISHRQLYPGVDVQKSPLPSSHTLLLEYNHREVRICSLMRNVYALIR